MDIFFAVLFYGTLFFLAGVGVVHIWEQETGR